jgi:hypothetical protein
MTPNQGDISVYRVRDAISVAVAHLALPLFRLAFSFGSLFTLLLLPLRISLALSLLSLSSPLLLLFLQCLFHLGFPLSLSSSLVLLPPLCRFSLGGFLFGFEGGRLRGGSGLPLSLLVLFGLLLLPVGE